MYYQHTITIPANTPESSPAKETIRVTYGMVAYVDVFFIPDCAGLVGVRLLYHNHQVFPSSGDKWFIRNEGGPRWEDELILSSAPFELDIEGYNTDTTYTHNVQIGFSILRERIAEVVQVVREDASEVLQELSE